jgi:hypothetical protein
MDGTGVLPEQGGDSLGNKKTAYAHSIIPHDIPNTVKIKS